MADHGHLTHEQEPKILFWFAETKSVAAKQKIFPALFETPAQNTVIYSSEQFGQEERNAS
jgi:hypothetical protein